MTERIIFQIDHISHEIIVDLVERGASCFWTDSASTAEKLRNLGNFKVYSSNVKTNPDYLLGREIKVQKIKSKEDELLALSSNAPYVLIETEDWKIIPLENLISKTQGTNKKIITQAKDLDDAEIMLTTLEVGVDAVVLQLDDNVNLKKVYEILDKYHKLDLIVFTVERITNVGPGDRACIDTCSILNEAEGLLVGSQAEGLFLMHNENISSPFVPKRPFRVNAGAIHSYVLMPDGSTSYLSELQSGIRTLVCNWNGETRILSVGRVKIERRPLIMVSASSSGKQYSITVQNAETINFVAPGGKPLPVNKLKTGDKILGIIQHGGRHLGWQIDETIIEK